MNDNAHLDNIIALLDNVAVPIVEKAQRGEGHIHSEACLLLRRICIAWQRHTEQLLRGGARVFGRHQDFLRITPLGALSE